MSATARETAQPVQSSRGKVTTRTTRPAVADGLSSAPQAASSATSISITVTIRVSSANAAEFFNSLLGPCRAAVVDLVEAQAGRALAEADVVAVGGPHPGGAVGPTGHSALPRHPHAFARDFLVIDHHRRDSLQDLAAG